MRTVIYCFCLLIFVACGGTCEDSINQNFTPEHGSFRIDSIYIDVGVHSSIMSDIHGNRIKFRGGTLEIPPVVGDSIYKEKGVFEYVLIKKDSTYVQSWSCDRQEAFIIDSWKNGEKEYIRSSNTQPNPFWDSSSSKNIHSGASLPQDDSCLLNQPVSDWTMNTKATLARELAQRSRVY